MLNQALATAHDELLKFLETQYADEKTTLLKKQELELAALKQSHVDRVAEIGVLFGLDYAVNIALAE